MQSMTDIRHNTKTKLDDRLAAWLGWFSAEPMPADLESLVEQLEAAYGETRAEAEAQA